MSEQTAECQVLCKLLDAANKFEAAAQKAKADYTGTDQSTLDALDDACETAMVIRQHIEDEADQKGCECEDGGEEPEE